MKVLTKNQMLKKSECELSFLPFKKRIVIFFTFQKIINEKKSIYLSVILCI
jgi:hypothetical protein